MWDELAYSFHHGNEYITTILVLAFFGLVLIFERISMLQFVYHLDFSKFLTNLRKILASEDTDRAISFCKSVKRTSLPQIALRALEAAETDPTTVRSTLEEETLGFLPRIEKRVSVLPLLGTLIMLIGILGTIDGLWSAFHSVDILDTAKKQVSLAQGIAKSLAPTSMGLLVCTLLLAGHHFVKSMAINLTDQIHRGVSVLHTLLVPAEVATYVAAAPGGGGHAAPAFESSESFTPEAKPTEAAAPAPDESFTDAAVENIKDEEEII
jgi:biopolymer transport protein ExbB